MAYSIIRYYYFLEDDRDVVEKFYTGLSPAGFNPGSKWSFEPEEEGQYIDMLNYRNMLVLVLGYKHPELWFKDQLTLLADWEKSAAFKANDLLAQVTVFASSRGDWNKALENIRQVYSCAEPVMLGTAQGQLARLDWKWPQNHAHYLFTSDKADTAADRFFSSFLPVIEASLLRTSMISNMYRDRNKTILAEKQNCDKLLANILHTQLVSQSASQKEIDEMESQVNELSSSYGILVGDYSLVAESKNKIKELIDESIRQLKSYRFLDLKPELIDAIIHPYRIHLEALGNLEVELRSSWENHQAAIGVVRSRIDIMISRENIKTQEHIKNLMETNTSIQEQSLTFQVAAGIIEFIVLAYYSHSLWKALVHNAYALVPPWAQFAAVLLFSAITVETTHLFAEYKQGHKHVKGKLILFFSALLVLLVVIIGVSAILEVKPAH